MPVLSTDAPGWAADAATLLRHSPARAGRCRVMAVEGRSGAGKSVIADWIATEIGCPVLRMDDLYPGWEGLSASVPLVGEWIVGPLREGRDPRWRPYDWERGEHSGWRHTPVADTLVIEGCGIGARELRPFVSVLTWVRVGRREREKRLAHRWDAALYAPYRSVWRHQEDAFYARHHPDDDAELVIDNTADSPDLA